MKFDERLTVMTDKVPGNIRQIVARFKKLTDGERYMLLSEIMEGHATTTAELNWRARLCSALERAHVYPQENPFENYEAHEDLSD